MSEISLWGVNTLTSRVSLITGSYQNKPRDAPLTIRPYIHSCQDPSLQGSWLHFSITRLS